MLKRVNWAECPECEKPLLLDTFDLMFGSLYFYCDNEQCEAHKEEREYFADLDMIDLHW